MLHPQHCQRLALQYNNAQGGTWPIILNLRHFYALRYRVYRSWQFDTLQLTGANLWEWAPSPHGWSSPPISLCAPAA